MQQFVLSISYWSDATFDWDRSSDDRTLDLVHLICLLFTAYQEIKYTHYAETDDNFSKFSGLL
jgi:hypothetical protein